MSFKSVPDLKKQQGIGFISVFAILAVSIFLGLFAFKVGPSYFEHWTIEKVVDDLVAKPELLKQPRSKIYAHINKAYRQNNLWDTNAEDTIHLKRDGKRGHIVTVQYERRQPLIHNIEVVTTFNKVVNGSPSAEM